MSKPFCLISGPVFNRSGYGDWATAVAKSIIRYDKFDVKVAPQKWGNCQSKRYMDDITDPEDKLLASKLLQGQLQKQPDLFIQLSIPNDLFIRIPFGPTTIIQLRNLVSIRFVKFAYKIQ